MPAGDRVPKFQPTPTRLPEQPARSSGAARLITGLQVGGSLFAVALVSLGTFQLHLSLSIAAFLLFPVIVVAALQLGFWQATVTSVCGVLFLDYFFSPPIYSFKTDPTGLMALATFEFAALVVSRLSAQVQLHSRIADVQSRSMERLYDLARQILTANRSEAIGLQIARFVLDAISVAGVAVFDGATLEVHSAGGGRATVETAARNCWLTERNADDAVERTWSRLLSTDDRSIGALTLQANQLSPIIVNAVASIAAIAMERSRSLEKETRAEAARQSEQLRTAVLDALAHAFKTPLTTIIAASSGLLDSDRLPVADRELLQLIDDQSVFLNDLTTRLLQTARLEGVATKLRREEFGLAQLIERLMEPFEAQFSERTVAIDMPQEDTELSGDHGLLITALHQLIDNALKYSEAGTPINIRAAKSGKNILISVHNDGSSILAAERERIFDRFYRTPATRHKAAGTGLGLSIAKQIIEAHGGRVWVGNDDAGPTFYVALPLVTDPGESGRASP